MTDTAGLMGAQTFVVVGVNPRGKGTSAETEAFRVFDMEPRNTILI